MKNPHKIIVAYICSVIWLLMLLSSAVTFAEPVWEDEKWLLARFREGNVDTVKALLDSIPAMTQAQQFLQGVFEPDGEAARFYYDRVLALFPNSAVEAMALERLWQYHWTKGDGKQAKQYWEFLKRRHPNYPGLEDPPDFNSENDLAGLVENKFVTGLSTKSGLMSGWTIQLGAFSNQEGALETARNAVPYGDVRYVEKIVKNKKLTIVQVGIYASKEEAEAAMRRIKAATGIKGRVVTFQDNQ